LINHKKKTVVICSNYAWTIINFRMPLIRSLREFGYKVVVITQFDGYEKKLINEVDKVYPLFISRKGINPFLDMITLCDLIKKLTYIKPDYLLLFTIKPVIYGSIAARIKSIPHIDMVTGLGTVFITRSWVTKVVKLLYRFSLKKASVVFFQNTEDKELFIDEGLVDEKICKLTPGSGIDLDKYKFSDLPNESNLTFLLIARMIKDKGVVEFVDAARQLKGLYPKINFQLLGPMDVENRTAISQTEMNQWVAEGIVEYLGKTDDVSLFIKESSCVVLPSYREGTSRVLLEAAAMGRPIVTSNVTGCREVVEDDLNGFLCKPKDSNDLVKKLQKMILLPYERKVEMGIFGRKKIEDEFDQSIVCKIYQDALKDLS
jgi:glycosyltransferase involved in cell wall biosynthesis